MGSVAGRGRKKLMTEINVTPFVDVMLVLLIVFMIAAPMMTQGLEVELPKTTAGALEQKEEPLVITINRDREVSIGKIKVSKTMLYQQLSRLSDQQKQNPLFLRADKEVPYGVVVAIMAEIKRAGFERLGMITMPLENKKDGAEK